MAQQILLRRVYDEPSPDDGLCRMGLVDLDNRA
jgi:hypothetical protein